MNLLKKITDKRILYIFTLLILVFLPILKQSSFYLVRFDVIKNYDSVNPAYVLYFSVPFLIYIYIKNIIKTDRDFDIYDYIFFALILAGFIASLFAIDGNISWFGKEYRHEGFFTILSYYLLFITWKVEGNKEDIKRIINVLIIMGVINSIYALFQLYTPFRFVLRYSTNTDMVTGICGNPNFFGSLIVTVLSIVTVNFLIERKVSIKNILLVILFFISLINSQSTGPILSYLLVILFFIIYLLIKKKTFIKNIIYLILMLIVTCFSVLIVNKHIFHIQKCEICDLIGFFSIVSNSNNSNLNNSAPAGQEPIYNNYRISGGRLDLWKNCLEIVKENPINGVGYDNFHLAYYEGINLSSVTFISKDGVTKAVLRYPEIYDNAHNTYLHTLVTSGVLGFVPYMLLCLLTFIKGLKTKDKLVMLLFGGFVAYSIQAFGNINVLQVTPIYYVIIGLILFNNQ